MNRPYIICHMVTSLDGKVTGDFLLRPECVGATDIYYRLNREMKRDGFICGRVTMEGSFTGGFYPDLSQYTPVRREDFIAKDPAGFYAVAFDTYGRLGWRSSKIVDPDGDPGYDGARIIEVLSEQADGRYLTYLRKMNIPYIFAGETEIDVSLALQKLKAHFDCHTLLLEGGSIINGAFLRADAVDEISLVVAPTVADTDGKPLFMDACFSRFSLAETQNENGNLLLRYKRREIIERP